MQVVDVAGRVRFADEKLQKIGLFQTPRCVLDLYCVKPGQAQKVHTHPDADKVYYVLSGRGRFTVGGDEREVGAGTAVLAPAGDAHGVENPGPDPLTILVLMTPPPRH